MFFFFWLFKRKFKNKWYFHRIRTDSCQISFVAVILGNRVDNKALCSGLLLYGLLTQPSEVYRCLHISNFKKLFSGWHSSHSGCHNRHYKETTGTADGNFSCNATCSEDSYEKGLTVSGWRQWGRQRQNLLLVLFGYIIMISWKYHTHRFSF